jgi:superfamily I DNA and/or RNA helicase
VIVVDLVRSNDQGELGFLTDVRRMNVAITRAKRWLLVLGDGALMTRHPYYKALLAHAEKTGAWVSAWSDEGEPLD